ncbi:short-chain dehydrogenase [Curtobacterium sp. MCJR17_055]|uniref:SDR family NAD(P)-dependent oxidoreductase n=1 Tax=unclassified Curtobacterium TaxID=257496 RepID=UPI000D82EFE3|nr:MULTISPECIES: SDR family NAD(P)-dependent oxidoreductase [unclassified Curtobacterium]PYY37858.1 short-chain dehydrogenase [Curtobacterium sp. MCBD17_029]PYY56884.1 short-chain dehydrogenase [Curtobacterium sp. MCJR17_055]PYY62200.1 short-chain dehydrogenase [Curtobacterium sp. MCPF17_015]WIB36045.1 SDR family NAD(P)-dependent oxidoreductase [Curtobacterium sp. MCJR17_043]
MSNDTTILTAASTVGTWLDHPVGGELIRELLAQGGTDPESLTPVRGLPLQQLVALSNGQLPQAAIDGLVLAANGGEMPVEAAANGDAEVVVPGRFAGQTVVVTGAGGGIGRATASRIAREGGRVVAVDIAPAGLEALVDELPGSDVVTVVGDITSEDDVQRVVQAAGDRIDGLANVAGITDTMAPLHETSDAVWERVMGVNVTGMFRLTRAVLPAMLAARRGSVVNIASEAALRGNAAGVAYTTSKHAVVGLTKNSAFMYGPSGIRINAVAPGGVATGIPTRFESELGSSRLQPLLQTIPAVATAQQLAASITFLLSDDGTNLNGVVLPSDGGWSVQ